VNQVFPILAVIIAILLAVGIIVALMAWKTSNKEKSEEPSFRADFKNDWYDSIAKQIHESTSTIIEKNYKKFKLNLLLCVAQRVAEFSPECGQCQTFQQDVTALTRDVSNLVQMADKEGRKAYFKSLNRIIGHLQRNHKLVTEGYYTGICMAIGSGLGVAIDIALDNTVPGIPLGVGVGLAIGAALDAKAKKEGRILCPRETTDSPKTVKVVLVGLGVGLLVALVAFILLRMLNPSHGTACIFL